VPGHAEVEVGGTKATLAQAPGHVDQEGCEALVRVLVGKQEQHFILMGDFPAEQAVHLVLQGWDGRAQPFETAIRNLADERCFKYLGRAGMGVLLDSVKRRDFSRKVESENLRATIYVASGGFCRATLDDVKRTKALSFSEQMVSPE